MNGIIEIGKTLYGLIDQSDTVRTLRIISFTVSLIMFGLLLILYLKFRRFIQNSVSIAETLVPPAAAPASAFENRWGEIQRHVESIREAEWKLSVIEADKLIEDALKKAGFPGETLGEKLMAIEPGQLLALQGLWEAHKTRNHLVHDSNYFLRHAEARRAVRLYEEALKELGAI